MAYMNLSDNLYWDATGVIVRGCNSTGSTAAATNANGNNRSLYADFYWCDAGGFAQDNTWTVSSANQGTKQFTFDQAFISTPIVVACLYSASTSNVVGKSDMSISATSTTATTVRLSNNSGSSMNCGVG